MAPDIKLGQSEASSLIRMPPDQLFLPFYPSVQKYKSRKGECREK